MGLAGFGALGIISISLVQGVTILHSTAPVPQQKMFNEKCRCCRQVRRNRARIGISLVNRQQVHAQQQYKYLIAITQTM
ncbi:hypothetical protein B0O99DRAFT_32836 [Bisporella sp. PMI_857]|nr:hypothetical protein B0O99DRAFT_32836 [Bisporella sp. PMI_857]